MQNEIQTEARGGLFFSKRLMTTVALVTAGIVCGGIAGTLPVPITLTAAAGMIAVILSIFRPEVTLALFFCGIVMMTDAVTSDSVDCFAIQDMDLIDGLPSALILFFLLMVGMTCARLIFIERRAPPISLCGLGVYAIVISLALGTGLIKSTDRELIRFDLMKMLFPVVCFYLCMITLNSRERVYRMLVVLLVVSILKALILAAFYFAGRGWIYHLDGSASYRVTTLDSADLLLCITLTLVIAHLLVSGKIRGGGILLLITASVPMLYVIIFSYRRAQWVGMLCSLGLLYFGASKSIKNKVLTLLAITLFAAGSFAALRGLNHPRVELITSRLTSLFNREESSNRYHVLESHQVLKDLSTDPILGLGLGSHHSRLPGYDTDVVPTNVVHNTFLYIWMKMGLPGLFFFLWAGARYIQMIWRYRREHLEDEDWGLILPLAASSGLWLIMFLSGPIPWYFHKTFLIALLASMAMSLIQQAKQIPEVIQR